MPPDQITEWMAEYVIRSEEMEEAKMAARAQAGVHDVKRGLRR